MAAQKLSPARERHWVCAQRLRERRLALGLTQLEVVARLQRQGNHTTNRGLSAMENGRGLDLGLLPEFAEALCCTVTYLLGLTTDPHAWHPPRPTLPIPPAARTSAEPTTAPVSRALGILGPDLPAGFATPVRARRRQPT